MYLAKFPDLIFFMFIELLIHNFKSQHTETNRVLSLFTRQLVEERRFSDSLSSDEHTISCD